MLLFLLSVSLRLFNEYDIRYKFINFLFSDDFILFTVIQSVEVQCALNACEVFDILTRGSKREHSPSTPNTCTNDIQWRQLDRRLRAIEQPSK